MQEHSASVQRLDVLIKSAGYFIKIVVSVIDFTKAFGAYT